MRDEPIPIEVYEHIAFGLQTEGFCIVVDFLPPVVIEQLRNELLQQWNKDEFRSAAIGKGENRTVNALIRNDEVKWLDMEAMTPSQHYYYQSMEGLRTMLNRQLYLGLVEFEVHLALYTAGSYYKKHVDQFRGSSLREVTVILYLNDDWQEKDGGELLMYNDMGNDQVFKKILPIGGQLVVFLSSEFPHEVLSAHRQRISITGWFKTREIN